MKLSNVFSDFKKTRTGLINTRTGFACNRDEPCRRSSRRGTPSESRAAENDAARRKVVRLANVGCSDPEGDHLASPSALSAMRCDHFDAIALGQLSIQAVTVVGFVADQLCKVPQVR